MSDDYQGGRMEYREGRNVGFGEAIRMAFRRYFDFAGRSQRAEYWWFYLFTVIASWVLSVVDIAFGLIEFQPLSTIFTLVTLIPTFAAAWRRMHDIGRSGWWNFLAVMPALVMALGIVLLTTSESAIGGVLAVIGGIGTLVASIYTIVLLATDSERGPNRFGPSPKYGFDADIFD